MDEDSRAGLAHLHDVAALGCLLNAISHDLNNQLTNLMLGADQAQYGGGPAAIDLMVQQAQRIADITRTVQQLGQRNMDHGRAQFDLARLCGDFAAEHEGRTGVSVSVSLGDREASVDASPCNLQLALSLLCRACGLDEGAPLALSVGVEQVPRSSWSGSTETIAMAAIRLGRADGMGEGSTRLKAVVDDFFDRERDPAEVALMAAWEILRKLRGRLTLHGETGSSAQGIVLMLPIVVPA